MNLKLCANWRVALTVRSRVRFGQCNVEDKLEPRISMTLVIGGGDGGYGWIEIAFKRIEVYGRFGGGTS